MRGLFCRGMMRRPSTIRLVLMGGGAVLLAGGGGVLLMRDSPACRQARQTQAADAEAVCRGGGGHTGTGGSTGSGSRTAIYTGGTASGASSGASASSAASVSRGGFGGTAHAAGS